MRKICTSLFFLSLFLHSNQNHAQSIDSIKVSGFLEVYFGKDQVIWNNHSRPNFLYSHTATDHVALNTAVFELKSYSKRINTHLALVEGTYANKVTSAEPTGFGALYLANISLALDQAKNCWLTAGIFPSHIGLETAIGLNNVSLTRSLAAENSPYYESG
ncbi:MAG: outer membrane beta-barrel protein, partial [Bacteroidota bacterium]